MKSIVGSLTGDKKDQKLMKISISCKLLLLLFAQKIWTIKALVTKIEIHQVSSGGDSKYVFHLVDESGEIRATAFDQKYFDLCEVGKVYRLSTCLLVSTDQSNTLKDHPYNNDYELVFRCFFWAILKYYCNKN